MAEPEVTAIIPVFNDHRSLEIAIPRSIELLSRITNGFELRHCRSLFFDPEGADFTLWINHFRNEVYRNWIVPQPALLGIRGHVDIEFTVMRDGAVVDVKVVKGSGAPAFDRASANAIVASRLLALPSDFRPDRVTMTATFFYNEDPRNS